MENIVRQRFKELLSAKGLTINKVATICNIPQSNVQKQLNGDTSISLKTILAILNGIDDLSAEWFLRGNGAMLCSNENKKENKTFIEKIVSALPACGDEEFYEAQLEEKDKTIRQQAKEISRLQAVIESLKNN